MRDATWECAMRLALSHWLEDHGFVSEAIAVLRCRLSVARVDSGARLHVIIVAATGTFQLLHPLARLGDWRVPRAPLDEAWSQYLSGESAVLHFQVVQTAAA
jgi:hypothetical protein